MLDDDLVRLPERYQVEPGDSPIPGAERDEGVAIGEYPEREPAGGIHTASNEAVAGQRLARRSLFDPKCRAVEGEFCDGRANDVDMLRLRADDDCRAVGR